MKTVITIDPASSNTIIHVAQLQGNVCLDGIITNERKTTIEKLYESFESVMKSQETRNDIRISSGVMPKNCVHFELLSTDFSKRAYWIEVPKNQWDITFYGNPFEKVGFPRMLFRYTLLDNRIINVHVFALREEQEITEDMPLYHFPYSNVHSSGMVCTGSVAYPNIQSPRQLESFHALFFGSDFNHDLSNYSSNEFVGERFKRMEQQVFNDDELI